jgi:uncharacterized protein
MKTLAIDTSLAAGSIAAREPSPHGIRVAERWKIGRERFDDGMILVVAKDDRKLRLEVGYGLEGAIPDAIAKRVIAETITPYFRQGDFYRGIEAGVQQLMRLIEGEALPPHEPAAGEGDDAVFGFLVIGGVVAGWLLSTLMSRPAAGGLAALGSGSLGALMLGFSPLLLFIALFVFAAVLSGFRGRGGGWSSGWGGRPPRRRSPRRPRRWCTATRRTRPRASRPPTRSPSTPRA